MTSDGFGLLGVVIAMVGVALDLLIKVFDYHQISAIPRNKVKSDDRSCIA